MLCLKRLKIILRCRFIYVFILFLAIVFYFISSNIDHVSKYDNFNKEEFVLTNIYEKDYGLKIELFGKEKVIGFLYYKSSSDIDSFLDIYGIGDRVIVSGDKVSVKNNTVPDTFNYKKYLVSNEIYNVIKVTDIRKKADNNNIFYGVKDKLIKRGKSLDKSYPYISSLIFGNNSYLDEDVLSSYRENGISHLFAISGLHISIFIGILGYILGKMKIPLFFRSLVLISFLLFYMFLTNFAMSVLRGAIFTILLLINKFFKLGISSVNLLLLALSIILFMNSLNLNNVGLQYSFLVTLFLIMFSGLINGNKIKAFFMISFISFLVSYPITINNFNQVNVLSILYNLFFVPYVSSILLPLTLISYVFSFLDGFLFFFIKIIEVSSQFLNSFDILKFSMCKMNVLMTGIYFVIVCRLFMLWNSKRIRYLCLLLCFFVVHFLMPFRNNDYVMFFDVGQGDSALINVNKNVTLIDTGGMVSFDDSEYKYKIAKNKIIPYLKANGIRKIDNMILTHGDADHMKEAVYIVNNFKVDKVIFNCGEFNSLENELVDVLKRRNISYSSCVNEVVVDKYRLKFLNSGIYDNENDNSSVIYFKYNDYKFLFMGDAGVEKEKDILDKYNISDIDVLKVGHHGSKTSSSKSFINEINPKNSIISVGEGNRYGHPNEEVLDTLNDSKIYRTDQDGSIMFKIKKDKLQIETCSP